MCFISVGAYDNGNRMNNSPKRRKRQSEDPAVAQADAIIQLTGGVLQSMFGVAYTDDVRKVVDRIDKIDDNLSKGIKTVKSSQQHLQEDTRQTLNKQDTTIHMVEKMAMTVEKKVSAKQIQSRLLDM